MFAHYSTAFFKFLILSAAATGWGKLFWTFTALSEWRSIYRNRISQIHKQILIENFSVMLLPKNWSQFLDKKNYWDLLQGTCDWRPQKSKLIIKGRAQCPRGLSPFFLRLFCILYIFYQCPFPSLSAHFEITSLWKCSDLNDPQILSQEFAMI